MRIVSAFSEKREKTESNNGVSAQQTIDSVGLVDSVDGELKEGQHEDPSPPAVHEVDAKGSAKIEGQEVPHIDDEHASRHLNR